MEGLKRLPSFWSSTSLRFSRGCWQSHNGISTGTGSAKETNAIAIHSEMFLQNLITRALSEIRQVQRLEMLKLNDSSRSMIPVL